MVAFYKVLIFELILMKRSHTIKIEDLQNSISEGSIEGINQEQVKKIKGGFCPPAFCPPDPPEPWPPCSNPDKQLL